MARKNTVVIIVLNWEKFNPRKDLKATSWLRLQNTIFEDPQFFDLSQSELLFWVYILCLASKAQSGELVVHVTHAVRVGRFDEKTIFAALSKLEQLQCVRICHADVTSTSQTRTTTNVTNVTNERNETNTAAKAGALDFESIFQSYPRRAGDSKKKTGLESLVKKVSTPEQFAKALRAAQNYAKHCDSENITGTKFVKQFSTFFGKDDTWLEYAEYTPTLLAARGAKPTYNRAEQRSQANRETLKNYLTTLNGDANEG